MSETLNIRVPEGTKQRLKDEAVKAGYSTLTDYIKAFLSADPARIPLSSTLLKATPLGRNALATHVSEAEKTAFINLCEIEGVKPAQALRRQVRIAIRNGPDFCKNEVLLLRQANRQLLAIGRNLNQVVRKINQDGGVVSQRLLTDLQATVKAHSADLVKLTSRVTKRASE